MKDELCGRIMTECVVLRKKIYVYSKLDEKLKDNHSKGTKKCVVTKSLTFEDYKICLFDSETKYRRQMLLQNKKHEV